MSSSTTAAERSAIAAHVQTWNPQQVNTPPQYLGRKTLPIKRGDAEPLTREDLQYDLLYFIFADSARVFVDPMAPGRPLVNFCDLYVNALFNSTKCSKVLKDKMVETPEFAIEFAKIALLTNVGRINTTMAFFPEMKTALRSYHPVPSLQKTDGNLQDAPRIKNCLKAALLPSEFKSQPPSSPQEILEKARAGQIPPTSVVNLIFVLANASHALAHFDPPLEFLDLFLPINLSSASRAHAFLWIMFHYLSGPNQPNPFDDDYSRNNTGKVPRMINLTREDMLRENQDPPEEIEWGRRMSAQRSKFLKELVDEMEMEKKRKKNPPALPPPLPPTPTVTLSAQEIAAIRRPRAHRHTASASEGSRGSSYGHEYPSSSISHPPSQLQQQIVPRAPRPHREAAPIGDPQQPRTMLEHAWHIVNTTDPLEDSDNEADEHVRLDYNRRLRVLSRLRGKAPTPPPMIATTTSTGGLPVHEPTYHQQPQFQTSFSQDSMGSGPQPSSSNAPTGKLRQVAW
ncbi:Ino eighty subunit 1 [Abortiporus biennis]